MPNIKSAEKRVEIAEIRRIRNAAIRSKVKTAIRKFRESLQSGNKADAQLFLIDAIKNVDKAANKGIIHKNAAARRKSNLQKIMNRANQG